MSKLINFRRFWRVPTLMRRNPIIVVLLLMVLTIGLIATSAYIRNRNNHVEPPVISATQVEVYQIGATPTIKALAKVEKKNVIQVRAQKSGIVQKLYVKEGDQIAGRGQTLAYISDNYQGGSAASIQRQIAQKQYENTQNTYQLQKDILAEQKNLAHKTDENSDELRDITRQSIDDTKSLISLNESIIAYLDENLALYEASNSADTNRDEIAATQQLKSSYLAALTSLRTSLRSAEYQANNDDALAQLSDSQKNLTLKQLELQEKALDLTLEISRLQVKLAGVSSSLAYPASFSNGDVERVHVRLGQQVNPGDVLFTISGCDRAVTLTALVPKRIAQTVSTTDPATVYIDHKTVGILPSHISNEATDGMSYVVQFVLPEDVYDQVSDKEFLPVHLPVGVPNTTAVMPFIPLDAVYQSNQGAYIFVAEDGVARTKKVALGQVYGQYVQVQEGLSSLDRVILNRTVVEGDTIEVQE